MKITRVLAASAIVAFPVLYSTAIATSAGADCYPQGCGTPTTLPGGHDEGSTAAPKTNTTTSTLPFTGGDVAGLAAIGAGAVLAGAVIVRQSRRNHATS